MCDRYEHPFHYMFLCGSVGKYPAFSVFSQVPWTYIVTYESQHSLQPRQSMSWSPACLGNLFWNIGLK